MQIQDKLSKTIENHPLYDYFDTRSSKSWKHVPYMSKRGPDQMPHFRNFALVRDSVRPRAQIWYIAGPMRAGHLSHVTYLSNQFCWIRQKDRFTANHPCILIAISLRSSDFITKLRKHEKVVYSSSECVTFSGKR